MSSTTTSSSSSIASTSSSKLDSKRESEEISVDCEETSLRLEARILTMEEMARVYKELENKDLPGTPLTEECDSMLNFNMLRINNFKLVEYKGKIGANNALASQAACNFIFKLMALIKILLKSAAAELLDVSELTDASPAIIDKCRFRIILAKTTLECAFAMLTFNLIMAKADVVAPLTWIPEDKLQPKLCEEWIQTNIEEQEQLERLNQLKDNHDAWSTFHIMYRDVVEMKLPGLCSLLNSFNLFRMILLPKAIEQLFEQLSNLFTRNRQDSISFKKCVDDSLSLVEESHRLFLLNKVEPEIYVFSDELKSMIQLAADNVLIKDSEINELLPLDQLMQPKNTLKESTEKIMKHHKYLYERSEIYQGKLLKAEILYGLTPLAYFLNSALITDDRFQNNITRGCATVEQTRMLSDIVSCYLLTQSHVAVEIMRYFNALEVYKTTIKQDRWLHTEAITRVLLAKTTMIGIMLNASFVSECLQCVVECNRVKVPLHWNPIPAFTPEHFNWIRSNVRLARHDLLERKMDILKTYIYLGADIPYYLQTNPAEVVDFINELKMLVPQLPNDDLIESMASLTNLFDPEDKIKADKCISIVKEQLSRTKVHAVMDAFQGSMAIHAPILFNYPSKKAVQKKKKKKAKKVVPTVSQITSNLVVAPVLAVSHPSPSSSSSNVEIDLLKIKCCQCHENFNKNEELIEVYCHERCKILYHRSCFNKLVESKFNCPGGKLKRLRWGDALCPKLDCRGTVCRVQHMLNSTTPRCTLLDLQPVSASVISSSYVEEEESSEEELVGEDEKSTSPVEVPVANNSSPPPSSQASSALHSLPRVPTKLIQLPRPTEAPAQSKAESSRAPKKAVKPTCKLSLDEFLSYQNGSGVDNNKHPRSKKHLVTSKTPTRYLALDLDGEGINTETAQELGRMGSHKMLKFETLIIFEYLSAMVAETIVNSLPSDALSYLDLDKCSEHFRAQFQRNAK